MRLAIWMSALSRVVSIVKDEGGLGMKMSMSLFRVTSPLAMLPCVMVAMFAFSKMFISLVASERSFASCFQCCLV